MLPDNTALVDAPIQLDHNLPRPVIVDVLKFVNVTCTEKHRCQNGLSCEGKGSHTMFLHDLEELDHHLGHRAHEDLALATLLRVVHGLWEEGKGGETMAIEGKP